MNKFGSSRLIVAATITLMAITLWLTNTIRASQSLEEALVDQKLKSELMLSEKLLAEKDLHKSNEQALSLRDKNRDLDHLLQTASGKLEKQNADMNRMQKENASLGEMRRQRAELTATKSQLQNELQALRTSHGELEAKNKEMESTVAFLQERNRLLAGDLNRAMFAAVDQSLVQAVRKNEKLTVKAGRTGKLIANFEVPAKYKDLSFRIVDSRGTVLSAKDGTITSASTPSERNYTASNSDVEGSELQKIEMTFIPKEKLKTGVYVVEISNENLYVGSLKIKLD